MGQIFKKFSCRIHQHLPGLKSEVVKGFQKFSCRTHLKLLGVMIAGVFFCAKYIVFSQERNTVRTHI